MHPHAKVLPQPTEQLHVVKMIGVVAEDILAFVTAGGDMIPPAGPFDAQCPRHESMEPTPDQLCQTLALPGVPR